MGTSCTFLGNDYGLSKPQHIKEYIEEQIVKLITLKQTDILPHILPQVSGGAKKERQK